MLWDPSFTSWQVLGVRSNSQMMVMASDLSVGSNLFYGFDEDQQSEVLGLLDQL